MPESFRVGGVIKGDQDGVADDANIAVQSLEQTFGKMSGVPAAEGITKPLTELVDGCLGDEGQRHLSISYMEIECARPIPSEGLIGMEEFFDMPAFGIVFDEELEFVAVPCGNEPFVMISIRFFSASLHDLVKG